jgi:hypothetical protein
MRILLTIIFLLHFGFVFGQNFSYPSINIQAKDINNFIPNNWKLLDSAQGDLNKDKQTDLALILQYKDSISIVNKDDDSIVTQPRILIILLYDPTTNQYQLEEKSNSFILYHDDPNMEDPYQDISINSGILKIDFSFFMFSGGWGMYHNSYKFRFQDTSFVLIGADESYVHRATGEREDRSYNFLTKKVKVSTGTISSDKQKVIWRTIDLKEQKTLKTFKEPFSWEVEKDFYL